MAIFNSELLVYQRVSHLDWWDSNSTRGLLWLIVPGDFFPEKSTEKRWKHHPKIHGKCWEIPTGNGNIYWIIMGLTGLFSMNFHGLVRFVLCFLHIKTRQLEDLNNVSIEKGTNERGSPMNPESSDVENSKKKISASCQFSKISMISLPWCFYMCSTEIPIVFPKFSHRDIPSVFPGFRHCNFL